MWTTKRSRTFGSMILVVVVGVVLVGCDSSDRSGSTPPPSTSSPSASPSATADVAAGCADVAALKSSAQTLSDVEPLQDGLNTLEAAIADTKTSLDTAVDSVTAELQPAVQQVQTQFAAVQAAAEGLTTETLRERAPVS